MTNPYVLSSGNLAADRRFEMARGLEQQGDFAAAADLMRQALELAPRWASGWFCLGNVLCREGNKRGAEEAFEQCRVCDPGDTLGAALELALLRGETPPSLPDAYVQSLFDQYAPRFDDALVNRLQYKAPSLLRAAVDRICPPCNKGERILDLGCGTGLSGEAFRDRASYLEGVDLSPAMIAEAEKKGIYDMLSVAEIGSYLKNCTNTFDLILAADVFVYIGQLDKTFEAVRHKLRTGGLLAFTAQSLKGESGFRLGEDHRYSYAASCLLQVLEEKEYKDIEITECQLRLDRGLPVTGFLVLAKV